MIEGHWPKLQLNMHALHVWGEAVSTINRVGVPGGHAPNGNFLNFTLPEVQSSAKFLHKIIEYTELIHFRSTQVGDGLILT